MSFQQTFDKIVELLDRNAKDFGESTLRSIRVIGQLFDGEGNPLSRHRRIVADDYTTGVPSPDSKRAAFAPATFQLTKPQVEHVLGVIRDANIERCPDCDQIQAYMEGWLKTTPWGTI